MMRHFSLARSLFFLFILASLLTALAGTVRAPVSAAPQQQVVFSVVISEFRFLGPAGGNDEFIELYNPTGSPIDISGWLIRGSNSAGSVSTRATIPPSTSLAPGQYYLVANTSTNGYSGAVLPDLTYTNGITDDGGVALTLPDSVTIIDAVGLSAGSAYKEGTPLIPLSGTANQSYERKTAGGGGNCNDTDNNQADFIWNQTTSNPQNSASLPVACITITNVTSPNPDGIYTTGNVIDVAVSFSAAVDVTGNPTLLLETGVTDRAASYLSGSGTNTLTFRYTVSSGDASNDLDYISASALTLNGGSIVGAVGNAVLILPNPGSPGSLGANKNIMIDNGAPPSFVSIRRQSPVSTATNSDTLTFRVTFNETVMGVDPTDFVVTGATGVLSVTAVSGDVYDVMVSGGSLPSYNGVVGLDLSPSEDIVDVFGNPLPLIEPATDETYIVDNISPSVMIEQAVGQADPTGMPPVQFAVTFSEPINASTFSVSDIRQTGTANFITWNITNSGDNQNFTLSAISIGQNGTLIPVIDSGRVADSAGNLNLASGGVDNSVTYQDTIQPTVTINQAGGQADPAIALPINFTVVFSEPILASVFTPSDITQTGTATGITWTITNSGDNRIFTVSATTVTVPGTIRPVIPANRVTDLVGNTNLASTSTDNTVTYSPPPTATPSPTRTPTRTRTPTPVRTPTRTPTRAPAPPPPLIAINEFLPRPGSDWNNDGLINQGDEYIELINHGVVNVNLSGYRLDDEANIGSSPYTLPAITLKPGERVVFYGSQTGLLLSDGGDGVRLLKPNGQLADAYNYSVVDFPDQAFCRLPDNGGADDWNENCFPTPGLRNSLSGSALRPPTLVDVDQPLCPIADTLPEEFVFAECAPFGVNIWNRFYWDRFGWFGARPLPFINSKWDVFAD
ncbi:MAG: lamin tail domain-containing protein [Chloroflexota bacterium]|nr:lamin tail domain-containing protein [Chloroflexota bacterium]MBI5703172.1 lamin tail domain-containing protein [Chloroflexota bacterium]